MSINYKRLDALSRIIEVVNTRISIIGGFIQREPHPYKEVLLQECQKCITQVVKIRNECTKETKMDEAALKDILFKDTEGGVRYDIRSLECKKVSWKALSCIATLAVLALGIAYGYQWNTKDTLTEAYVKMVETNTENIAKNAKVVHTVLTQQVGISTNIDWIKKSLRRIEKANGSIRVERSDSFRGN